MTKISISIPKPCHENWQAMTPEDKGRFCASCQKKVYDFTRSSDREIVTAFQQNQNLCGRFLSTQLNRDLVKPKEKNSVWMAISATVISLMGIGTQEAKAQETIKTEQTDKKVFLGKPALTKPTNIEISGIVKDASGPLPGANIVVKGTKISTQTDFNGNFKIEAKIGDTLVISFTGYETQEYKVKRKKPIAVKLTEGQVMLGEVIIEE